MRGAVPSARERLFERLIESARKAKDAWLHDVTIASERYVELLAPFLRETVAVDKSAWEAAAKDLALDTLEPNSEVVVEGDFPLPMFRRAMVGSEPYCYPSDGLTSHDFVLIEISVAIFDATVSDFLEAQSRHVGEAISQLPELTLMAQGAVKEIEHLAFEMLKFLVEKISELVNAFDRPEVTNVSERLVPWLQGHRAQLGRELISQEAALALELEEQARSTLEEVERVADVARESAGMTGTAGMAGYFLKFAHAQQHRATACQIAAGLLLVGSLLAAYWHVAAADSLDGLDVARRLSVGIPIAITLTISIREATVHRNHALWARHISVQLQTVRAYCEDLPPPEKADLLRSFGKVVFSGPPDFKFSREGSDDLTDLMLAMIRDKSMEFASRQLK